MAHESSSRILKLVGFILKHKGQSANWAYYARRINATEEELWIALRAAAELSTSVRIDASEDERDA